MSEFGDEINRVINTDSVQFASFFIASCCDISNKLDFDMVRMIQAACRSSKLRLTMCEEGVISIFGYKFGKHVHNFEKGEFTKVKKGSFSTGKTYTHHMKEQMLSETEIYNILIQHVIAKLYQDFPDNTDTICLMFKVNQ